MTAQEYIVAKKKTGTRVAKVTMKDGTKWLETGNLRKELRAFGTQLARVTNNKTAKYKDAVDATAQLMKLLEQDCQKNLNFTFWSGDAKAAGKKK